MTNENFLSASRKHFNDATHLLEMGRPDNCAYLSGYVVECGLKTLVEASSNLNPRKFGHDVSALSSKVTFLAAALSPARRHITLPSSQDYNDLLCHWTPEERYQTEGVTTPALATSRLAAAKETIDTIVNEMILNGTSV